MSEMVLEGEAKSADYDSLHPRHYLKDDPAEVGKGFFWNVLGAIFRR